MCYFLFFMARKPHCSPRGLEARGVKGGRRLRMGLSPSVHLGFLRFSRLLPVLPPGTRRDIKIVFLIGFLILNLLSHWRQSCNFSHQSYTACEFCRGPSRPAAARCWPGKANFLKKEARSLSLGLVCLSGFCHSLVSGSFVFHSLLHFSF